MLKEWPLVAFTIAGQVAVGSFLLLFPLLILSSPGTSWSAAARHTVLIVWGMIFGLIAIAAGLSFFHLHHPFRARRVLANFRSSWLSREIFFELAFMALVVLAFFLVWTGHTRGLFLRTVMSVAALAGILFLVSMSKLYMLKSLPTWNSAYTGISFSLTAMTSGAMATAWVTGSPPGVPSSFLSALWTAAMFFVASDILFAVLLTPQYGIAGFRPGPSLRPPARAPRLLHLGRLALLAGGLFLIVLEIVTDIPSVAGRFSSGPMLTLAFVLVLLGEIAGRFLFYGLVPQPGD
jgi:DMSO reductase anchor subunit